MADGPGDIDWEDLTEEQREAVREAERRNKEYVDKNFPREKPGDEKKGEYAGMTEAQIREAIEKREYERAVKEYEKEQRDKETEAVRGRARFKARGGVTGELIKITGAPQAKEEIARQVREEYQGFKKGGGLLGLGIRSLIGGKTKKKTTSGEVVEVREGGLRGLLRGVRRRQMVNLSKRGLIRQDIREKETIVIKASKPMIVFGGSGGRPMMRQKKPPFSR